MAWKVLIRPKMDETEKQMVRPFLYLGVSLALGLIGKHKHLTNPVLSLALSFGCLVWMVMAVIAWRHIKPPDRQ